MGRGPRRARARFQDKPGLREFVRHEWASPRDGAGRPERTAANRQEWQRESDRLADWILGLHPGVQKKMSIWAIRCPEGGCLLGRLYRVGDPRGPVRYVWLGNNGSGRGTAGIANWPWDGYRGMKEYMIAGCPHGSGHVEFGLLDQLSEAVDFPREGPKENWLHHYHEVVQRGYARRTAILPESEWVKRA